MESITIRNLDDEVKKQLCIRATENGRSMAEEARTILCEAVTGKCGRRRDSAGEGPRNRNP